MVGKAGESDKQNLGSHSTKGAIPCAAFFALVVDIFCNRQEPVGFLDLGVEFEGKA